MNVPMNTETNVTTEQADALIERLGMTDEVEDYEMNELGHVYTLANGSRMVVTSPTTFSLHGENE